VRIALNEAKSVLRSRRRLAAGVVQLAPPQADVSDVGLRQLVEQLAPAAAHSVRQPMARPLRRPPESSSSSIRPDQAIASMVTMRPGHDRSVMQRTLNAR